MVKWKFELFFRWSRGVGQTVCFKIPPSKIALSEILISEYENLILGGAILAGMTDNAIERCKNEKVIYEFASFKCIV